MDNQKKFSRKVRFSFNESVRWPVEKRVFEEVDVKLRMSLGQSLRPVRAGRPIDRFQQMQVAQNLRNEFNV